MWKGHTVYVVFHMHADKSAIPCYSKTGIGYHPGCRYLEMVYAKEDAFNSSRVVEMGDMQRRSGSCIDILAGFLVCSWEGSRTDPRGKLDVVDTRDALTSEELPRSEEPEGGGVPSWPAHWKGGTAMLSEISRVWRNGRGARHGAFRCLGIHVGHQHPSRTLVKLKRRRVRAKPTRGVLLCHSSLKR